MRYRKTGQYYAVRYAAFLDILGFKDLILELKNSSASISRLRDPLRRMQAPNIKARGADIRIQSISDAIVVSASATANGLWSLTEVLEDLTRDLLSSGLLLRGALVKDRLFHDEQVVFGEALVNAFYLESNVARYPRIMLTRQVVSDFANFATGSPHRYEWNERKLRQAEDGPFFLHVLGFYRQVFQGDQVREDRLSTVEKYGIETVRDIIQEKLEVSVDNPSHFEKVKWFASYWNEVFEGMDDVPRVDIPGDPAIVLSR